MQLKDCPFCGGKAELKENEYVRDNHNPNEKRWFVRCMSFDCGTSQGWLYKKEHAIRLWNIRNKVVEE